MKTTAFALAVLAAVATAEMKTIPATQASAVEDNSLLGKIKLWNCLTCTAAFKGLDDFIDSDTFRTPFMNAATKLCLWTGKLEDPTICGGAVHSYGPALFDATSNYLLGKDRWCNEILNVCTHLKVEEEDLHHVVDKILATKPKSLANDDFVDNMYEQMAAEMIADDTEREIIRAVHISDVHIDFSYAVGSKA